MGNDSADSSFLMRMKPYVLVVLGYMAVMILILVVLDNFVMPSIVHNNEKVRVPNLVGDLQIIAENKLKSKNLEARVTREIYSEKFKEGTIVNQTPTANSEVKSGRPIFLTLSKGKETVPVPYLIGSTLRNARVNLLQRGLELGEIEYVFNEYYPKDTVVSQSRQAGDYVPYGSSINISISKGSELQNKIPSLLGFSYDEINQVITESGFVLGNVSYKISETYLPNTIINQSPAADETAPPGTPISVVISK